MALGAAISSAVASAVKAIDRNQSARIGDMSSPSLILRAAPPEQMQSTAVQLQSPTELL